MAIEVEATYENGILRLDQPLPLDDQQRVKVSIALLRLGGGDDDLAWKFQDLVRTWKTERGPTSSVVKMAAHPAYRQIVQMGKPAVPLLLAELERQPDHWFLALHEITGADPVPKESRGRVKEMAEAWLQWGKDNGIAW